MAFLARYCYCSSALSSTAVLPWTRKHLGHNHSQKHALSQSPRDYVVFCVRALARRSVKKLKKTGDTQKKLDLKDTNNEVVLDSDRSGIEDSVAKDVKDSSNSNSVKVASRSSVIQACTVTSGLIAALGIVIRQVSHVASVEGLPIIDCSAEVSFLFETWHVMLVMGLVIIISFCRLLLLKAWPDFAESSQLANKQVLTSLELPDYILVSFFPGVSEELLFRGALLPVFGMDWKSTLLAATIFGVLHLGDGRNISFAIWATFVGLLYGYATILSSSVAVSMVAHALNNLVGGILWRYYESESSK